MTDEFDHDEAPDILPPLLPDIQAPAQAEINARAELEFIRIELSKVNTTAIRTPEAFVSWLRSKL